VTITWLLVMLIALGRFLTGMKLRTGLRLLLPVVGLSPLHWHRPKPLPAFDYGYLRAIFSV
jgi:hypothetical protein